MEVYENNQRVVEKDTYYLIGNEGNKIKVEL